MSPMDSQAVILARRRRARGLVAALGTALVAWLVAAGPAVAYPLPGTIWTIAGGGGSCVVPTGSCGDGPDPTAAQFRVPAGVAVDGAGNLYIAEEFGHKIAS